MNEVHDHADVIDHMQSCQRFDRCSTNVCPLDPDWRKRRHIEGEPVCSYLLEAVKATGPEVFEAGTLAFLRAQAKEIGAAFPAIGRMLAKASSRGSKILSVRGTSAYRGDKSVPMPKVRLSASPALS